MGNFLKKYFYFLCFSSVPQWGSARKFSEYLPKMVFGMKICQAADGGNRIVTVFQVFDGNVDLDGV